MTRKQKRRAVIPWVLLCLLAAIGLYYSLERIGQLLPRPPGAGMRETAQELPGSSRFAELARWTFDRPDSLKQWEEKIFKGKTDFRVRSETGEEYLSSTSRDACSGLYVKTNEPVTPGLWIDWKWRALQFPAKKRPDLLSNRAEDDFAARLYVIFEASNLFRSDVIEYIWDQSLPVGTTADSPYSDRIKLLVIRSGPEGDAGERLKAERRNLYQDYRTLFGREPKHPVGLIALMSDSDNTGSTAEADFGEIVLKRKL